MDFRIDVLAKLNNITEELFDKGELGYLISLVEADVNGIKRHFNDKG